MRNSFNDLKWPVSNRKFRVRIKVRNLSFVNIMGVLYVF